MAPLARIFFALSLVAVLLLAVNIVVGLSIGDYNGLTRRFLKLTDEMRSAERTQRHGNADESTNDSRAGQGSARAETTQDLPRLRAELEEARMNFVAVDRWKTFHFLFGVFASLVTLLVNAVSVTYFIGTSRWCREVSDAYQLDGEAAAASTRLKRRTFPWALFGMLTMVTIVGLGAASDPMGSVRNAENFVMLHRIVAIVGTAAIGWSLLMQVGNVGANHKLIEQILADVRRVRRERGLDDDTADEMLASASRNSES